MSKFTSTTPAELVWQDLRQHLATGRLANFGEQVPADTALIDVGHLLDYDHPGGVPYDLMRQVRVAFRDLRPEGELHLPHTSTALLTRFVDADGAPTTILLIGFDRAEPFFLCYGHRDGEWTACGTFCVSRSLGNGQWETRVSHGWGMDPTAAIKIMFGSLALIFARCGVSYETRKVPIPADRKKAHPLAPGHVITLRVDQPQLRIALASETPFASAPRTIAAHLRAGCYVRYRSGKVGWRRPTSVNGGISPSAYRVEQTPARRPSGRGTGSPSQSVVEAVLATYQGEEMARDVTLGFGRVSERPSG